MKALLAQLNVQKNPFLVPHVRVKGKWDMPRLWSGLLPLFTAGATLWLWFDLECDCTGILYGLRWCCKSYYSRYHYQKLFIFCHLVVFPSLFLTIL